MCVIVVLFSSAGAVAFVVVDDDGDDNVLGNAASHLLVLLGPVWSRQVMAHSKWDPSWLGPPG